MTPRRPEGAALPRARKTKAAAPGRKPAPRPPTFDEQMIVVSEAFDPAFYRDVYADVAQGGQDPVLHYLTGGWREDRDPAPWFSTRAYVADHPEAAAPGMNPFFHYLTVGRAKGWAPSSPDWREEVRRFRPPVAERIAQARRKAQAPGRSAPTALRGALAGIEAAHVTVSQDDYTRVVGGVQLCIDREAQALGGARAHLHLFPAVGLPAVSDDPTYGVSVLLDRRPLGTFAVSDLQVLAEALAPAGRSTVAIHSLLGHHPETLAEILAACRPAQAFFWIHDFAAACDGYTLLKDDLAFCGGPPRGAEICRTCVYGPLRARHLEAHDRLLARLAPTLVAPSTTAAEIWRRARSEPDAPVVVHPHAFIEPTSADAAVERPLKVAFPGLPLPHKGWPAFRRLADSLAGDERYEFHHFGDAPDPRARVNFHKVAVTAERPDAMAEALARHGADLAVIWSICPETFCLTAREAVAAGARLVAFADSGAAAAYARDEDAGVVLASDEALIDFFRSGAAVELAQRSGRRGQLRLSGMSCDLMAEAARHG